MRFHHRPGLNPRFIRSLLQRKEGIEAPPQFPSPVTLLKDPQSWDTNCVCISEDKHESVGSRPRCLLSKAQLAPTNDLIGGLWHQKSSEARRDLEPCTGPELWEPAGNVQSLVGQKQPSRPGPAKHQGPSNFFLWSFLLALLFQNHWNAGVEVWGLKETMSPQTKRRQEGHSGVKAIEG